MSHYPAKILKPESEMDQQDIFSNLPSETIVNILSRIPIKAVFACKCVCTSWLGLLETREFTRSHISMSAPGLLTHHRENGTDAFTIVEFEDSLDIEHPELHYKTVLKLDINENCRLRYGSKMFVKGSANGLVLFGNRSARSRDHYICNPVTRECIKLPGPEGIHRYPKSETCGFGVSRSSNRYKFVRIFFDYECDYDTDELLSVAESVLQAYTLGTGSWRDIDTPREMLDYSCCSVGKFLNGNLHWLARDLTDSWWVSCFDLETEVFTKFRAPIVESGWYNLAVGVLGDRLCVSDNTSESEITIYLMKDEDKTWSKEYVLSYKIPDFAPGFYSTVVPVKAFQDGDLLMVTEDLPFSCHFSDRSKAMTIVDDVLNVDDDDDDDTRRIMSFAVEVLPYTPSFVSLKDFETECAELFDFECLMN